MAKKISAKAKYRHGGSNENGMAKMAKWRKYQIEKAA